MNKNYIRTLATAGVGVFLITGLGGCDNHDDCIRNAQYAPNPQKAMQECKTRSSGYVPISSHGTYSNTGYVPNTNYAPPPTNTTTTKSGFFSSKSGSVSSGFSS